MQDALNKLRWEFKKQGWLLKADVAKFRLQLQAHEAQKDVEDFFDKLESMADQNNDGRITFDDVKTAYTNASESVREQLRALVNDDEADKS